MMRQQLAARRGAGAHRHKNGRKTEHKDQAHHQRRTPAPAARPPSPELATYGISHVISGWVVAQEDPATTEEIDAKTAHEILRYLSKTFNESPEEDEAKEGDTSVFALPNVSDTSESEDS